MRPTYEELRDMAKMLLRRADCFPSEDHIDAYAKSVSVPVLLEKTALELWKCQFAEDEYTNELRHQLNQLDTVGVLDYDRSGDG